MATSSLRKCIACGKEKDEEAHFYRAQHSRACKVKNYQKERREGRSSNACRRAAFEAYPARCNRCGYAEHLEILVAHHVDRDRTNNQVSNLEILCPTCHAVAHLLLGNSRLGPSARTRK